MKVIAWPAYKTKYKNPYNWLLYTSMAEQGVVIEEFSPFKVLYQNYDIFHLHWPVETIVRHPNLAIAIARTITMLRLIDWLKARGSRIMWTIHDQTPHLILHPKLADWFQSQFVQRVDGIISLCQASREVSEKLFPSLKDCPHWIIPHGHYRDAYPNQVTKRDAKKKLNLPQDSRILLFLGYIDIYKNVPHLIRVFQELSPPDWILVIAGQPEFPQIKAEVKQATNQAKKVKLFLNYIPEEELQFYFNAADLVVLPFQEILNSGSALLSLSFNRPVLVPEQGAMTELQALVGKSWVNVYSGNLTPNMLNQALDWAINQVRSNPVELKSLDWLKLSQETILAYSTLVQST